MRPISMVAGLALMVALSGCGDADEAESLGRKDLAYDPVCDVGPITIDGVTYQVTGVEIVGTYTPAPAPTLGPILSDGVLERFDDGTATWTGNGRVVTFDSHTDEGMFRVC